MQLFSERRIERMYKAVQSGRIIPYMAFVLITITLLAALVVRLFAHGEFTSFGESVWWAAQTVTTVGYGDVIPNTAFSKVVAVFVMIFGISTVSLSTAVITSVVISSMQRRDPDRRSLRRGVGGHRQAARGPRAHRAPADRRRPTGRTRLAAAAAVSPAIWRRSASTPTASRTRSEKHDVPAVRLRRRAPPHDQHHECHDRPERDPGLRERPGEPVARPPARLRVARDPHARAA